jgi:2-amino-4-hydroxy-6-hydroxymethyldihydropteridine diphosphokinase
MPASRQSVRNEAYVALGSNQDDSVGHVRQAFSDLAALPRTRLAKRSSLYRTAPVGFLEQPDFINAVALLETGLVPLALLRELLAIEKRHGRVRAAPNGPRTLDLDLLIYADLQLQLPGLTLPHPRMRERAFVLAPLAEIGPDLIIPGGRRVTDYLRECASQHVVLLER